MTMRITLIGLALVLMLMFAIVAGSPAHAADPTPVPTATPIRLIVAPPAPKEYDPLTIATARQVEQTCRGACTSTVVHPGDCHIDFSCASVTAPSVVVYAGTVAGRAAPAEAVVVIRAPNTGDGGLTH
jgi:hypothetical protein